MEHTLGVLREHFRCPEPFAVALDFGCGVGRLLIPLARRSRVAVGVDASAAMVDECRQNAARFGISNTACPPERRDFAGQVGFVCSFLVRQHIPPARGMGIIGRLRDLLCPGGLGALHVAAGPPRPVNDSLREGRARGF